MRIVLVEFSPSGGLFQYTFQLGAALAREGHSVDLVTGRDPEFDSREPNLALVPILPTWHPRGGEGVSITTRRLRRGLRAFQYIAAWFSVWFYLLRKPPDVVQFSEWRFPVDGVFALGVIRTLRMRRHLVVADVAHTPVPLDEIRGRGDPYKRDPILTWSLNAAYKAVDVIFVLGKTSAAQFRDAWDTRADIVVVPHGTEEIYADDDIVPASSTQAQLLFFGAWNRYKGLDLLLDAFARVRAEAGDASLTIAGTVGRDVPFDEIKGRADAIGNVEIIDRYVDADEVPALFNRARAVVLPYRYANQSGVAYLAANFSRPVVATDVGDLAEAVLNGETGIIVAPADPAALAEAMLCLVDDPAEASRMGANAREYVAISASWKEIAEKVGHTYAQRLTQSS